MMNLLVLLFFCFAQVATAAENVCATDSWSPQAKTDGEIKAQCGGSATSACARTRKFLFEASERYRAMAETACQKNNAAIAEINELSQSESYAQIEAKANAGKADINQLLAENDKILRQIPQASLTNVDSLSKVTAEPTYAGASMRPQSNKVLTRLKSNYNSFRSQPRLIEKNRLTGADYKVFSGDGATRELNTLKQSEEFMASLLTDRKKNEAALADLEKARANAANLKNKNNSVSDDQDTSSGSGFNPMSLLPAVAAFAPLLMQQNAASDVSDSSLTDPTAGLGGNSTNTNASNSTDATKGTSLLDDKPSQTAGVDLSGGTGKPNHGLEKPEGPGEPLAAYTGLEGTISSSGEGAGAKSSGGAGGSNNGSAGGASLGGSPGAGASDKEKSDRAPASAPTAAEEGALPAGGGGGLNFTPTASSDTAEDGMKDVLHDMEATLEDVPTGVFAESEEEQSAGADIGGENSESLFPRVRSCYVRNLKKGQVLNGLGEKLPDSE